MEQYENRGVKKGLVILLVVIVAAASSLVTLAASRLYRTTSGGYYTVSEEYYDYLVRYKRLFEVESMLKEGHLYTASDEDFVNSAIKGLTGALGDVYTRYMTSEEYEQVTQDHNGVMVGVGILMSTDAEDSLVTVVRVYPNTPGEAAGVRKGDKVIAVDDRVVTDMSLSDVADLMRGEAGTQVKIDVLRDGEMVPIRITRDQFEVDRVTAKTFDNIGYIQITEFTGNAKDRFMEELDRFVEAGVSGLVIDLRDNPGGYVTDVCEMTDRLLPEGTIVYTQDRDGKQEVMESDADYVDLPIAVLVNGNSASASEIMSGALQDYGRATIIGTTTYGKGLVQITVPFTSDGAALKYTFAQYFTPKGRNINGIGIEPDIYIEQEPVEGNALLITDDQDTQLQKALDVLRTQISGGTTETE